MNEIEKLLEEYTRLCDATYGRYRSWCWCYLRFRPYFENDHLNDPVSDQDKDTLALNLGFYLASWGMYRGSSFLLQHDYKFLTDIVKVLIDNRERWSPLLGAKLNSYCEKDSENTALIRKLYSEINDTFTTLLGQSGKQVHSRILITKILLGTLGCVPALDRFFVDTMKTKKMEISKDIGEIMQTLGEYYKKNLSNIQVTSPNLDGIAELDYPEAKILDMVFWQASYRIALAKSALAKASANARCKKNSKRTDTQEQAIQSALSENEDYKRIYKDVFGGNDSHKSEFKDGVRIEVKRREDYPLYDQFLEDVAKTIIAYGGEEDVEEEE